MYHSITTLSNNIKAAGVNCNLKRVFRCKKSLSIMPKSVYRVYVIELSKRVFTEDSKFRNANPQFNGVLECLYVGMTGKTPAERLKQHTT
ncbi:MAG: hypothetical protein ABI723_08550, partial [Bacteroidia bacterium]